MQRHRSTQPRVSNEPQNSNFEAGTALENLRAEVMDIEALARAAEAAAEALASRTHRSPRSPRRWRRSGGRLRADHARSAQEALRRSAKRPSGAPPSAR